MFHMLLITVDPSNDTSLKYINMLICNWMSQGMSQKGVFSQLAISYTFTFCHIIVQHIPSRCSANPLGLLLLRISGENADFDQICKFLDSRHILFPRNRSKFRMQEWICITNVKAKAINGS